MKTGTFTGLVWLIVMILISQSLKAQYQISGKVIDASTGEGLAGVNIYLPDKSAGTISDNKSEFTLKSSKAIESIIVSYTGYKTQEIKVNEKYLIIKMEAAMVELEQVIISATRDQQERKTVPVSISKIQLTEINDLKANYFPQLLERISSVHVANFGNEQQSLAIRQPLSFARTQLVMLEDEVPIGPTSLTTSGDLNDINISVVKEIEVIRGPSSSLYGSEAVGGALNFVSKNPTLFPSAQIKAQTSNWGYNRVDLSGGSSFGKIGIFGGGYYAQRRNGYREHSDFDKLTFSLKSVYRINDDSKLTAFATFSDFYNDFASSLDSLTFYTNTTFNQHTFTYVKDKTARFYLRYDKDWNENSKTFINLFYRYKSEEAIPSYLIKLIAFFPKKKYAGQYISSYYNSYGLIAQHRQKFSFLNSSLIAGLTGNITPNHYYSEVIDVTNSGDTFTSYKMTGTPVQNFNALLFNTAFYLSYEIKPTDKINIQTGIRYDRLDYQYDNHLDPSAASGAPDTFDNFHHLCPKIGITYLPTTHVGLFANFSVGFAPPLFTQLYNTVRVPVLKPSTYYSYEAGSWLSFNQKKGYLDLSAYLSEGTNEIVEVFEAGATTNKSVGHTRHKGIEVTLKYQIFNWFDIRYAGTYAIHEFIDFNEGSNDFSGNEMNLAPRYISNTYLIIKPQKGIFKGLKFSSDWQRVGSYFLDEQNSEKYDGYHLFNSRIAYTLKNFEIWFNVLNLTNKLYAVRVSKSYFGNPIKPVIVKSYSPGIPRTFEIGLAYNFLAKPNY